VRPSTAACECLCKLTFHEDAKIEKQLGQLAPFSDRCKGLLAIYSASYYDSLRAVKTAMKPACAQFKVAVKTVGVMLKQLNEVRLQTGSSFAIKILHHDFPLLLLIRKTIRIGSITLRH
jgi:hypothetical protein